MTAKDFLKQARGIYLSIESKVEQMERLQSLSMRVTTIITGVPGGGNRQGSRMEESIVDILDAPIEQLRLEITDLMKTRAGIVKALSQIDNDTERLLLEYRYLSFASWRSISKIMQMSQSRIFELHKNGLEKIERIIKKHSSPE